ncbi:MAG: hypothetical protein FWC47_01285 [Oscillospiraceae bacterium]|nr:hypothetical protein [Oscillospiraceae bacterium]
MNESNLTTYKKWAPDNAKWAAWVKPVLFAGSPNYSYIELSIPKVSWLFDDFGDTAIIVDLPGKTGVEMGLGLARLGYRPVPLYNGVDGPNRYSMIVDVYDIICALYSGAEELSSLYLRDDAPPAFLLDSNRMNGNVIQGKFDNRWCIFPQDMPSATFLLHNGIKKIIVYTQTKQNDLTHILLRYQEKGIVIFTCDMSGNLKKETISKPSRFKSLFYRFLVISGLKRNAAGGFGSMIPEPSSRGYGVG